MPRKCLIQKLFHHESTVEMYCPAERNCLAEDMPGAGQQMTEAYACNLHY
jgi:hypothetical protein